MFWISILLKFILNYELLTETSLPSAESPRCIWAVGDASCSSISWTIQGLWPSNARQSWMNVSGCKERYRSLSRSRQRLLESGTLRSTEQSSSQIMFLESNTSMIESGFIPVVIFGCKSMKSCSRASLSIVSICMQKIRTMIYTSTLRERHRYYVKQIRYLHKLMYNNYIIMLASDGQKLTKKFVTNSLTNSFQLQH